MLPIFEYNDDATLTLDEETEAQLIRVAQGHAATLGKADPEAAKNRLLEAYGPAIRAAVSRYSVTNGNEHPTGSLSTGVRSTEDLQSAALLGALEAIAVHDTTRYRRLGGTMVLYLNRALADEAAPAFAVPSRTLSRFFGIIRAADGDVAAAELLAPEYEMSRETFRDLRELVSAQSLDAFDGEEGPAVAQAAVSALHSPTPISDVEDRILVDMAFRAMDDEELRVCELYYGFTEYDPVPDAEIAHRIGASRPAVQRKRMRALSKARKALGVELEEI